MASCAFRGLGVVCESWRTSFFPALTSALKACIVFTQYVLISYEISSGGMIAAGVELGTLGAKRHTALWKGHTWPHAVQKSPRMT